MSGDEEDPALHFFLIVEKSSYVGILLLLIIYIESGLGI